MTEIGLALRLDSINGPAYFLRGKIYAELGDNERASEDLFMAWRIARQRGDQETVDKVKEELRSLGILQ